MANNVVMPQMGESIAEGTIVRWIKKIGEAVDRDEPLFEISTDKVDAEIPSPAAGVLTEIRVKEGETVPVNSVVAVIGDAGGGPARPRGPRRRWPAGGRGRPAGTRHRGAAAPSGATAVQRGGGRRRPRPRARTICGARNRLRSSAGSRSEHNVDIQQIKGTGISGRVTKQRHPRFHRVRAKAARSQRRERRAAGAGRSRPYEPGENVQSCR